MNNSELRDFLYREIPLSHFMGIEITLADENKVEVSAPLEPSQNHMDTAFGGSIGAVLILSCYAWFFHRLKNEGFDCHVLIKEAKTEYLLPVKENLKAECLAPLHSEYETFLNQFKRKGLARLNLEATLKTSKGNAAHFKGIFVAQKSKS